MEMVINVRTYLSISLVFHLMCLSNTTTRLYIGIHFDWSSGYWRCIVIDGGGEWNIGNRRKKNLAAGGELHFRTNSPVFSSTICHAGQDPSSTTFFARPGTCVDRHFLTFWATRQAHNFSTGRLASACRRLLQWWRPKSTHRPYFA